MTSTGALGQSYVAIDDNTAVSQSPVAIHDETPSVTLFVIDIRGGRAVKFIDKNVTNTPKARPSIEIRITNFLLKI